MRMIQRHTNESQETENALRKAVLAYQVALVFYCIVFAARAEPTG